MLSIANTNADTTNNDTNSNDTNIDTSNDKRTYNNSDNDDATEHLLLTLKVGKNNNHLGGQTTNT